MTTARLNARAVGRGHRGVWRAEIQKLDPGHATLDRLTGTACAYLWTVCHGVYPLDPHSS